MYYTKGKPVKHSSSIINSIDVGAFKQCIMIRGKSQSEAAKLTELLLKLLNEHHEENVKEYTIQKVALVLKDTMDPTEARIAAAKLYNYNLLQL